MACLHVISLKVGASHGLWQYKVSGTHERIILNGLRDVLDRSCQLRGFDPSDRSVVYLLSFSAEPFEGEHVSLAEVREVPAGCYYSVLRSRIGDFKARALFPHSVMASYLAAWPDRLHLRLDRSLTGGIVS